jgi:hypothetical protein
MSWIATVILFVVILNSLFDRARSSPKPLGQTIEVKAVERWCEDSISYIRCRGEDLKMSNEVIKTMIRIAKAESNFNEKAKNPKSSASGVFQIIKSTWRLYGCKGDVFKFKDNIDCGWRIYMTSGFRPWLASVNKWL